jgi:MoaA/NifB/PqqE/SkfB family radical SAM enzyme
MISKNLFFDRKHKYVNIDITYRCPLECLRCSRQLHRDKEEKIPGNDMLLEDFSKITNYFKRISFCGQYSDPIHHPKFIDMLKMCKEKDVKTEIHVASSFKSKKFYIKAFKSYPDARWVFGIDGLPHESHTYRINQDGEKLFKIMLESKKYLTTKPVWQYIIFKYNQDHVDTALEMARENKINFLIVNSSRWKDSNDYLTPTIRR